MGREKQPEYCGFSDSKSPVMPKGYSQILANHCIPESPFVTRRPRPLPPSNPIYRNIPMAKKAVKAAPKAAKAAKAPKQPTITLKNLGNDLADAHQMNKKQTNLMLADLVERITKHLKKGDRIRMAGLGILQVRKRPARMGRNPATGEAIKIKASKKVAFRAAKELKQAV